ncbi:MAG: putative glycolipid-binding domain-containing protein [Pseudomonas sp.]|uniref:putative glycolipid-binding domain-containing protein n=1 Tax=Pseudomonas sp. TaxID=306 RepID=UPI003981F733
MQQTLVWKPWHNPGVENLRLNIDEHGINATSHLMQSLRGNSIVASYVINCDTRWRFRRLWLKVDNHGQRSINLKRDIRGNWFHNGEPRPDLSECQQIMLSDSPFTHTPTLQRCALETGQSESLQVAYIDLLTLKVEARSQRYQHLREEAGKTLYRYESPGIESSELTVDEHALLVKASNQFLRLSSKDLKLNTWV